MYAQNTKVAEPWSSCRDSISHRVRAEALDSYVQPFAATTSGLCPCGASTVSRCPSTNFAVSASKKAPMMPLRWWTPLTSSANGNTC